MPRLTRGPISERSGGVDIGLNRLLGSSRSEDEDLHANLTILRLALTIEVIPLTLRAGDQMTRGIHNAPDIQLQ